MEEQQITKKKDPMFLLVIGMAGSGKTTFINRLLKENQAMDKSTLYTVNLDPAVTYLPYVADLDIRKSVSYKDLMKKHGLGPNGAILTSLNLFCTNFDKTIQVIEQQKQYVDLVVVDTPGQIEVFTWSASGTIIANSLAKSAPTVLLYVVDLARCENPNSFMSNMLFCCSILYKMKLPLVVVLNKADISPPDKVIEWINNFESYLKDLEKDPRYLSDLSRSMCLALDDFYKDLNVCPVSSFSGLGFDKLQESLEKARKEYYDTYYQDIKTWKEAKDEVERQKMQKQMEQFQKEYNHDKLIQESSQGQTQQKINIVDPSKAQKVMVDIEEEMEIPQNKEVQIEEEQNEQTKSVQTQFTQLKL